MAYNGLIHPTSPIWVSTPSFGACVSGTADTERCVFSPASCTSAETYRPAFEASTCANPGDVPAGRCTGSADEYRCAATREACFYPSFFDAEGGSGNKQPRDDVMLGQCSLQYGEGGDGFTLYPACRNKPTNDRKDFTYKCILFRDECTAVTEDLISATWMLTEEKFQGKSDRLLTNFTLVLICYQACLCQ